MLDLLSRAHLYRKTRPTIASYFADTRVQKAYREQRLAIGEALANTQFHHGTDSRHYAFDAKRKQFDADINDSLFTLIARGIHPSDDLFSKRFMAAEGPTISLTEKRMYARVYADLHESEAEPSVQFRYGSSAFWWRYFVSRMYADGFRDIKALQSKTRSILAKLRLVPPIPKPTLTMNVSTWMNSFRHDPELQRKLDLKGSIAEAVRSNLAADHLMAYGKSTITGNFPVIIGIKPDVIIPAVSRSRGMRMFETRTSHYIPTDQWTYIEVPAAHLQATRRVVKELLGEHQSPPVFASEHVELYCAHESSWSTLTKPHPGYKEATL